MIEMMYIHGAETEYKCGVVILELYIFKVWQSKERNLRDDVNALKELLQLMKLRLTLVTKPFSSLGNICNIDREIINSSNVFRWLL